MRDEPIYHVCKKCGRRVDVITWGMFRRCIVDVEAVEVIADPQGEDFVRFDGSKVMARLADRYDDDTVEAEFAFRPHRKTCGVSE